jgi:hypothetical protein
MNDAFNAFNTAVTSPTLITNTSPPGAVQSGIEYGALVTAVADFGLLTADAVNVFAEDFEAAITEALSVAQLAVAIVGVVTGAAAGAAPA